MRSNLFGSKCKGDIAGVDDDTAIFLFDEDRRKLMGPWVSIKEGELDPAAFRGSLPYQVGHTSFEVLHSDLGARGPHRLPEMLVAPAILSHLGQPLRLPHLVIMNEASQRPPQSACNNCQCFGPAALPPMLSAFMGTAAARRLTKNVLKPWCPLHGAFAAKQPLQSQLPQSAARSLPWLLAAGQGEEAFACFV